MSRPLKYANTHADNHAAHFFEGSDLKVADSAQVPCLKEMLPQVCVLLEEHPVPHRKHCGYAMLADEFQSSQQERGK